ncbi:MAG: hypothetical protein Q9202_002828 [Teloschistes flavicans]
MDWEEWHSLRTKLDYFQIGLRAFTRYVKEESMQTEFQERLKTIREDERSLRTEAQALESTIRDTLQVKSGIKSLKESRVSIEEEKRIKLRKTTAVHCIHSHPSGFFNLWHECPGDQQPREAHIDIRPDRHIADKRCHCLLASGSRMESPWYKTGASLLEHLE